MQGLLISGRSWHHGLRATDPDGPLPEQAQVENQVGAKFRRAFKQLVSFKLLEKSMKQLSHLKS